MVKLPSHKNEQDSREVSPVTCLPQLFCGFNLCIWSHISGRCGIGNFSLVFLALSRSVCPFSARHSGLILFLWRKCQSSLKLAEPLTLPPSGRVLVFFAAQTMQQASESAPSSGAEVGIHCPLLCLWLWRVQGVGVFWGRPRRTRSCRPHRETCTLPREPQIWVCSLGWSQTQKAPDQRLPFHVCKGVSPTSARGLSL